jgi:hypothetical protein
MRNKKSNNPIDIYLALFEELQRLGIRASHQNDDESVEIAQSAIAHLQQLRTVFILIFSAFTILFMALVILK